MIQDLNEFSKIFDHSTTMRKLHDNNFLELFNNIQVIWCIDWLDLLTQILSFDD